MKTTQTMYEKTALYIWGKQAYILNKIQVPQ